MCCVSLYLVAGCRNGGHCAVSGTVATCLNLIRCDFTLSVCVLILHDCRVTERWCQHYRGIAQSRHKGMMRRKQPRNLFPLFTFSTCVQCSHLISISNPFWVTIKYLTVIVFNWFLAKNNFSSKNVARTVWEWSKWGGENWKLAVIGREVLTGLFLTGLLTHLMPGGKKSILPKQAEKALSSFSQFHSIIPTS